MSSTLLKNFSLLNATSIKLDATTFSQNFELPNKSLDIMLINETTSTIFVRTGNAAVVADLFAMPILPGEKGVYASGNTLGQTTHIAIIVEVGSAGISVLEGSGN